MFSGSVYGDFFAFRPQTGLWVGGWVPPIPQTFFGTNNNSEGGRGGRGRALQTDSVKRFWNPPLLEDGIKILWMNMNFISVPIKRTQLLVYFLYLLI